MTDLKTDTPGSLPSAPVPCPKKEWVPPLSTVSTSAVKHLTEGNISAGDDGSGTYTLS